RSISLLLLILAPCGLNAQQPTITPNGIVNAASFSSGGLVPGSLAVANGTFAVSSSSASPPLATNLSGASLQFANVLQAPLSNTSGTRIAFQVPWELSSVTQTTIKATINGQSSASQTLAITPFLPAIFTTNGQGTGQGLIPDASGKTVDSSNPAIAGTT